MNKALEKGKMKTGYKLVLVCEGRRYSMACPRKGKVQYVPGKVVRCRRGCGPLAVFKYVQDARRALEAWRETYLEMWRCEYSPTTRRLMMPDGKVYRLWTRRSYTIWGTVLPVPPGTDYAESVRLVKRIA